MLCIVAPPIAETYLRQWPDGIDASITIVCLTVMFGIPILGYVFMVVDFRRYLRSLRRALMVVKQYVPELPYWAVLARRPACLQALNLTLPCTEAEVLAAYREQAKTMHPDRGGDLQKFLLLQKHFEQAMRIARGELDA
jgi:hypothetical protein